jgi:hypothetical protein
MPMTSIPNTTIAPAVVRATGEAPTVLDSPTAPVSHRPLSGRYRGRRGDFEVELRVDVDGARPMHRVSADYFRLQGEEIVYAGSMRVDAPVIVSSGSLLTITGVARSSWHPEPATVRVTIPRGLSDAPATLSHLAANGRVRARWACMYESASFRQAILEETTQPGVQRFESYDTGSLPAGCPSRTLTHLSAFRDAGIEMVRTREPDVLRSADLAANVSWSDAELQAAMMQYFTAYADVPQWAIWMLHARLHDNDLGAAQPRVYGLMFDRRGEQRQGCAVFYQGIAGTSPTRQRVQLFTCVHELGHGFNLAHSFQKSVAIPPLPSRPGSLTWMAYPDLFPGGAAAFWPEFPFGFDDGELVHLRHAFREDVIMGGSPFMAGAAFTQDAILEAGQEEDPGLRLTLKVQPALPYGVPVTVDFELSGTTREGRRAPTCMGPRPGNAAVEIRRPDGTAVVFEPLLRHCVTDDGIMLRAGDPPVRDSAFIHYGRNGFAFDRPGRYEIRARCDVPDGRCVLSDVVRIDVRPPVTRADHAAADLAFGDEQGALMSLVGSDAVQLRGGNEALQTLVERYPDHPVAAVPRLTHATNAAREYKAIQIDGSIRVRGSLPQEAAAILRGNPGVEVLRAAAAGDEAAVPRAVAQFLSRTPPDATSARVVHPYIRSRINEITRVLPWVLAASQQAALAPSRLVRPRRVTGSRRLRSP